MEDEHSVSAEELRETHEAMRVHFEAQQRESHASEQAQAGLIRKIQRLEADLRETQQHQAEEHARWLADQERRQAADLQEWCLRAQEAETAQRRLEAEAKALWDERHLRALEANRRLQRELEIAQAVAKLAPVGRQYAPVANTPAENLEGGQRVMIELLRELVGMIRGEEPGGRAPAGQPPVAEAETQVSFPPEPLWPDAFRAREYTTEDYAQTLGVEAPERE